MKRNKRYITLKMLAAALVTSCIATTTSFAGQWVQEGSDRKYQNDNGSYATNWQWIDGKSYCFDEKGNMYAGTTTPDGYTVDGSGVWTVNGVVQIQGNKETHAITVGETPLKGRLDSWFVIESAQNPAVWSGNVDTSPVIKWIWGTDYVSNHPELTNGMTAEDYIMKRAIEDKNSRYMFEPSSDYGVNSMALAELTGLGRVGNAEYYSLKGARIDAVKREIVNFLNSFPEWQTASDFNKAVRICNWIHQADYEDGYPDNPYAYGCLVNKKANCDGYANAAVLLAWSIDLPIAQLGSINHTYPVFLIDGVWLANEPTSKDKYFTVADVYKYNELGYYQQLGKYCEGVGYVIPTEESQVKHISGSVDTIWGRTAIHFN